MTKLIDQRFISTEMTNDQELLEVKNYLLSVISSMTIGNELQIINGGKADSVFLAESIDGGKANGN
jgi:hypothetical protein